jgi:hypothetical protein
MFSSCRFDITFTRFIVTVIRAMGPRKTEDREELAGDDAVKEDALDAADDAEASVDEEVRVLNSHGVHPETNAVSSQPH